MLDEIIRKHALKNAFEYGKAQPSGIVGKVIAEYPDAKKDMKHTMELIAKIVKEVNELGKEKIEEEMKNYTFEEKKEEGERKFKLEGLEEGKVITRFLPEPNGYLHIGHAKAAFLSYELARQYSGKCILRFDDTNPESEKLEFVDAIKRNLEWLGLEFASENFTSDKMHVLYKFASKMMILGKAYVCDCNQEVMNKNRYDKIACACRERRGGENLHLWDRMIRGEVEKGDMIVRFMGNMESENSVMRDPTLFRINKTEHYRQGNKFCVWPTYDFEVSISDTLDDVTHALRSKEYELRDELYYAILSSVNMRKPVVYDFSRLNIKGTALSKRFLKPLIEQNKVLGWDDPRLPTLDGLKRRGILPAAIKEFVLRQGLSKVESEPAFEDLLAINRKMLDPVAAHYFFVEEPVKITITNIAENKKAQLSSHVKGRERNFSVGSEIYISREDARHLKKDEVIRLKDLFNIKITKKGKTEIDAQFLEGDAAQKMKKLHWLPVDEKQTIPAEIITVSTLLNEKGEFNEDGLLIKKGICEKNAHDAKVDEVVQFERFGFCRLDRKEKEKLYFVFSC
ncbi:glutamate--tRNA ligase [Candidatus Micrarchaeota archaeon]|nr:glutamate--tRNA ligase [Candidatus Micrarchaeota archaeon]